MLILSHLQLYLHILIYAKKSVETMNQKIKTKKYKFILDGREITCYSN